MKLRTWIRIFLWISLYLSSFEIVFASFSPQKNITLIIKKVPVTVNGKQSELFRIEQPDGTWGYHGIKGDYFDAIVKNQTDVPTTLHWHGIILPNDQDGVPFVTQLPIQPGGEYHYRFKLNQSGTYWMHSHYGLEIQRHLSAPLIISDPEEKQKDIKEIIMFLVDFNYKDPEETLKQLQKGIKHHMNMGNHTMKMPAKMDLFDVKYDAYLTNYRTLMDPEVIRMAPGQTVRLRVINGASATNFFVNTGKLKGEVIATDGQAIMPLQGNEFQLTAAQRLDILVQIPEGVEDAYPILAQGEGTRMQTGLILATPKALIPTLSEHTQAEAGALNYEQELQYKAIYPLSEKKPEQTLIVNLGGDMSEYVWTINDQIWPNVKPLEITPHKRVEIVFNNLTEMTHPMHLHGHTFEVTEIDGKPLKNGPMRDTVFILPHSTVKIQLDSLYPGNWMLHCHLAYHQDSGMMTYANYRGFPFPQTLLGVPLQ